jgi:AcrR family transcriptional regulator
MQETVAKSMERGLAEQRGGGRERLLREARARFVARGYADVTMQEVAEAASVTKAAIYYHFGDKESLFIEVVQEEVQRICQGMTAEIERHSTFREQLEAVAFFLLESGNVDFGRLMKDSERYVSEERRQALKEETPRPVLAMRPAFERAAAAGEVGPGNLDLSISLYLNMVFGQIRSATFRRIQPVSRRDLARAIADMVIQGIGTGVGGDPPSA